VLHPADGNFWRPAATDAEREQDAQWLREAGLDLPPAAPLIASAGLEFRDYPTLIDAVAQLPPATRVVIAAASPWSKRKNTASGVDLPPNVTWVSLKPYQLRALYRRAQIVAIPLYDVDFQAGSLVAYEALACGRPVVISRTRGQNDIVRAAETGLYVPPGDSAAMATALNSLLADPARRAQMGAAARADVEAGLNLDTYLRQMTQIVEEVRARHAAKPTTATTEPVAMPGAADGQRRIG
jgi:glycosyltransferase involved in cell wall biosynthesis